jgi:hypothetical protein
LQTICGPSIPATLHLPAESTREKAADSKRRKSGPGEEKLMREGFSTDD